MIRSTRLSRPRRIAAAAFERANARPILGESSDLRSENGSHEIQQECERVAKATPKLYSAIIREEFDASVRRHEKNGRV